MSPLSIFTWLLFQAAALSLAALRVPLAADYPRASERLAVYFVLAAQLFGAAALMPWLLRGWSSAALAAASAWPLLGLAAMLSTVPFGRAVTLGAYVTAWVATLAAWHAALPGRRTQFICTAVAATWAAGGPLLAYLHLEFSQSDSPAPGAEWRHGPVVAAFSMVEVGPASASPWLVLAAVGGAAVLVLALRQKYRRPPLEPGLA